MFSFWVRRRGGRERPNSRFEKPARASAARRPAGRRQQRSGWRRSRAASRRNTGCHSFQARRRITNRRPVRTTWAGTRISEVDERAKLHRQQSAFLLGLLVLPEPARFGQAQRQPRLEVPGQRRDQHVGVVAEQIVERRVQRPNGIQLRQKVLLLAAIIGVEHDFFGRAVPIVGEVEEVAVVVEQLLLPRFAHLQILPEDDQAIGRACRRPADTASRLPTRPPAECP